jgi:hypothetical protein
MKIKDGLTEVEETLSAELKEMLPEALATAQTLARATPSRDESAPLSVHQFHARIGRWNTTFVDSIRVQFPDPKNFRSLWLSGLMDRVAEIEREQRSNSKYGGRIFQTSSEHEVVRFLKSPILRKYIFTFLDRNFYRNFRARTRAKPHDHLWQVWFGRGAMPWGGPASKKRTEKRGRLVSC